MRHYTSILIALLVLTNIAFGAVGDAGVSDSSPAAQSGQSYIAGTAEDVNSESPGYQAADYQSSGYQASQNDGSSRSTTYQGYSQTQGYSQQGKNYQQPQQSTTNYAANYGSNDYGSNNAASAPEIAGPYQERLSADDLNFRQPEAESFKPDSSLNFASASLPSGIFVENYDPEQGQGYWYYPGSVTSRNKFYVQTSSGLKTTAGCSYGGYLPLWSDINSAGNFYVYEWYPGQWTPSVRWWGWTWTGFKKGWFTGDVPGWHILSYNCRDWSNYVYIYVWPRSGAAYTSSSNRQSPSIPSTAQLTSAYLPEGAPTPPDPNAENLILPDFNLLQVSESNYQGQAGSQQNPIHSNPAQSTYPAQGSCSACSDRTNTLIQSTYPAQSYPAQSGCTACADKTGYSTHAVSQVALQVAPQGYVAQTYQAVYPRPTTYRSNEYYVQVYPGKLTTVAGVKCGDWLPLWSKLGGAGVYWSFEWAQGCSPQVYCRPEVKNFGYKGEGWYQTWFRGNNPGWHILSYYDNDWSNYIYIYAWPV